MTPREKVQNNLVAFLEKAKHNGAPFFDAPYGILPGIQPYGNGKLRVIAFGVSRYLDACIKIYSPDKIVVEGQGGLAYKVNGFFKSETEVVEFFRKEFHYVTFEE